MIFISMRMFLSLTPAFAKNVVEENKRDDENDDDNNDDDNSDDDDTHLPKSSQKI